MLNAIDAGHDAIAFLMSDSEKAGGFRSLLIGRSADLPTSWQDLYNRRFRYECWDPQQFSGINPKTGTTVQEEWCSDRETLNDVLIKSICPLLDELSPADRKRFMAGKSDKVGPGLLRLLHGLKKGARFFPVGHSWPSTDVCHNVVQHCLDAGVHGHSAPITLSGMAAAYKHYTSKPTSLLDGVKKHLLKTGQIGSGAGSNCSRPSVTGIKLPVEGEPEVVLIQCAVHPQFITTMFELY